MNKKNILIIEDDLDMNALYTKILGQEYNLLVTVDTTEARKKLAEHKVDLIILDLMLPNESGDAFLSVLKKDPKYKHIEVLVITTFEDIWNAVKRLYPDITCVFKPFRKDDLLEIIKNKLVSEEGVKPVVRKDQLVNRIEKKKSETSNKKRGNNR